MNPNFIQGDVPTNKGELETIVLRMFDDLTYHGFDTVETRNAIVNSGIPMMSLVMLVVGYIMVGNNETHFNSDKKVKNVKFGNMVSSNFQELRKIPILSGLKFSRISMAFLPLTAALAKFGEDNNKMVKQFKSMMPVIWEVSTLLGPLALISRDQAIVAYKEQTRLLSGKGGQPRKKISDITDEEANRWIDIAIDGLKQDEEVFDYFTRNKTIDSWDLLDAMVWCSGRGIPGLTIAPATISAMATSLSSPAVQPIPTPSGPTPPSVKPKTKISTECGDAISKLSKADFGDEWNLNKFKAIESMTTFPNICAAIQGGFPDHDYQTVADTVSNSLTEIHKTYMTLRELDVKMIPSKEFFDWFDKSTLIEVLGNYGYTPSDRINYWTATAKHTMIPIAKKTTK